MKISVIGSGYVGLVSGACFSNMAHEVCCYDLSIDVLKNLQAGISPFYEPKLDKLLINNIRNKKLRFVSDINYAISHGDIIIIAINTPQDSKGIPQIDNLKNTVLKIIKQCKDNKIILIKSTVPIGITRQLSEAARSLNSRVSIIHNPEFLSEGKAVNDFYNPTRLIIGADSEYVDEDSINKIISLYSSFIDCKKILLMPTIDSEFAKYASNVLLASRISVINELAEISDKSGVNIRNILKALKLDPRIGDKYLEPGIGYGGSCLTKDLNAMINHAKSKGIKVNLLQNIQDRNEAQKNILVEKALNHYNGDITGKCFTVWGQSFKPDTSDTRNSPGLALVEQLLEYDVEIKIYDPKASIDVVNKNSNKIIQKQSINDSLDNSDALFIATDWLEFKNFGYTNIMDRINDRVIFDGRNIFLDSCLQENIGQYYGIGYSTKGCG